MSKGGIDIYQYPDGRYRLRVFRKNTRHYLGMFPSYEDAIAAREKFLIDTDNGQLCVEPEAPMYTKRWFEQQADKQRIDFASRYMN